ncbi:MAG: hypothetical protein ACRD93_03745 [Nitrososphaeraceae archaeon]
MTTEIPVQYTHSVKIEDTAKGIGLSVHVYANGLETAVNEAIKLYQATKQKAEQEKIPVAPMEVK